MANETGPSIKIPIDGTGLKTIQSAREMARLASAEVKKLQRELEASAKKGQALDAQSQASLARARASQAAAESVVTRFKAQAGAMRAAAQNMREMSGDRRQAFGAIRGLVTQGPSFNRGGIMDAADIFKVMGDSKTAEFLERGALKWGLMATAGIAGVNWAQGFAKERQDTIVSARRLQLLAGEGKVGGVYARAAQQDIQKPWAFWRDTAQEKYEGNVRLGKMHPELASRRDLEAAMVSSNVADVHSSFFKGAPQMLVPQRRRFMAKRITDYLLKAIEQERKSRSSGLKRPWTAEDESMAVESALGLTQEKFGISAENMTRFGADFQKIQQERKDKAKDYNTIVPPEVFAPRAKRWDNMIRPYFKPGDGGIFGQDGGGAGFGFGAPGNGAMVLPGGRVIQAGPGGFQDAMFGKPNQGGGMTLPGGGRIEAGGMQGAFNDYLGQFPIDTKMVPNPLHTHGKDVNPIEHNPNWAKTLFGGDKKQTQVDMNIRQLAPLADPQASFAISREQYAFSTGRGVAKTTDARIA